MIQHSHQTAPTQFAKAAGVRFAHRRLRAHRAYSQLRTALGEAGGQQAGDDGSSEITPIRV